MSKKSEIMAFISDKVKDMGTCGEHVEVTEDMRLTRDLGLDSLDVIELVMVCEVEFSVCIPDDCVTGKMSVKDLVNTIEDRLG